MERPEVQSCDVDIRGVINTDSIPVVDVDIGRRVIDKLGMQIDQVCWLSIARLCGRTPSSPSATR